MPNKVQVPTRHLDQYTRYCNQPEFRKCEAPNRAGELLPEMPMPFSEEDTVEYVLIGDTFHRDHGDRMVIHTGNDEGFLFYCLGDYKWEERKWVLHLGIAFSPEWDDSLIFYRD